MILIRCTAYVLGVYECCISEHSLVIFFEPGCLPWLHIFCELTCLKILDVLKSLRFRDIMFDSKHEFAVLPANFIVDERTLTTTLSLKTPQVRVNVADT